MKPRKDYYAPMHTAEHILNQTMIRMFKCERSFSNHIEQKKSKCDYRFTRNIEPAEIETIEQQINEVIASNCAITDEMLSYEQAAKSFNLGKLPSNIVDKIRIVRVGNYDVCPCIGAHVENTSEIGLFKITTTNYENGVLRIRYKLLDRE